MPRFNLSGIAPRFMAAECTKAIGATNDVDRRAVFALLRKLWITLANACPSMSDREVAEEIRVLRRVHIDLAAAKMGRRLH
jgi:hypothetical protein